MDGAVQGEVGGFLEPGGNRLELIWPGPWRITASESRSGFTGLPNGVSHIRPLCLLELPNFAVILSLTVKRSSSA
jgi:hypothetical protein